MDQYGEMVAKIKNHRYGKKKGSANFAYIGYRTAVVGAIRAIRTERNFRFSVTHAPSNTFRAHAHVSIENSGDASEQVLMPNDRRELMHELIHAMPVDEAPPDA